MQVQARFLAVRLAADPVEVEQPAADRPVVPDDLAGRGDSPVLLVLQA